MTRFYAYIVIVLLLCSACAQEPLEVKPVHLSPAQEVAMDTLPNKTLWVFMMAGQSNMAGRALVEAEDTMLNSRIFTVNKKGKIVLGREPFHFYEPRDAGLDCGLSFGNELLHHIPDSISILILPTAVGGTSIKQWINNETFRNVTLFSNFKEKVALGKSLGIIKGVLWHQGENDAMHPEMIGAYDQQLKTLFALFRQEIGNPDLPIFIGELGSFSENDQHWQAINKEIKEYIQTDANAYLIQTSDLNDNGDKVHFNAAAQRMMGQRFAEQFIRIQK